MKEQTILEFTKLKLKKVDWFQKSSKVDREELTINEILKYEQLKKYQNSYSLNIFIYPLYLLFWAGLYSIVYNIAFGLDFSNVFLLVVVFVGKYWLYAIVLGLLFIEFPSQLSKQKYNRMLIRKIMKERSNNKRSSK